MITFLQKIQNNGGPKNFQVKFFRWLNTQNYDYDFATNFFKRKKFIFVNAGSKRIIYLIFQKLTGTVIVQRLNGLNDLDDFTNYKTKLKAALSNYSMNFIRKRIADKVIYQSLFVKERWEKKYGITNAKTKIIYNPYFDRFQNFSKIKNFNLLIMEGNIQNDIKTFKLLKIIFHAVSRNEMIKKIYIFGNTSNRFKRLFKSYKNIVFVGYVEKKEIIKLIKNKKFIYFPIEFKASCPNSLIELLARGVPSCFIKSGSLKELTRFSSIEIKASNINISLSNRINEALYKIVKNYDVYSSLTNLLSRRYSSHKIFNSYIDFIKN